MILLGVVVLALFAIQKVEASGGLQSLTQPSNTIGSNYKNRPPTGIDYLGLPGRPENGPSPWAGGNFILTNPASPFRPDPGGTGGSSPGSGSGQPGSQSPTNLSGSAKGPCTSCAHIVRGLN